MSYGHIIGVGNVQAGTYDYIRVPKKIRGATKYPVILLHGASTTSDFEIDGVGWPEMLKLADILYDAGIPSIAGYMAGNNFGIDAVCNSSGYINTALSYIASKSGCSSSKAHVFGVSMGGGAALRWAGLNPSKAASVGGIVPAVSTQHLYTDNPTNVVLNGFPQLIASAWGLSYRAVADGVTHSNNILDSATGAFTSADIGKYLTRSYNNTGGIPVNTTITAINSSTQVQMSNAATASVGAVSVGIGAPLPMSGDAGADLIGHFAPVLASNSIPNRWYYSTADPYIYAADVTAAATAAGGTAIQVSTSTGHSNATAALVDTWNSGTDFSDLVNWFIANGA